MFFLKDVFSLCLTHMQKPLVFVHEKKNVAWERKPLAQKFTQFYTWK